MHVAPIKHRPLQVVPNDCAAFGDHQEALCKIARDTCDRNANSIFKGCTAVALLACANGAKNGVRNGWGGGFKGVLLGGVTGCLLWGGAPMAACLVSLYVHKEMCDNNYDGCVESYMLTIDCCVANGGMANCP